MKLNLHNNDSNFNKVADKKHDKTQDMREHLMNSQKIKINTNQEQLIRSIKHG